MHRFLRFSHTTRRRFVHALHSRKKFFVSQATVDYKAECLAELRPRPFRVLKLPTRHPFPRFETDPSHIHPPETPRNRSGAITRQSGRVGRRFYAQMKAEITLHNIPTSPGNILAPPAFNFEFLCPAATTWPPIPSRTPGPP